MREVEHEIDGKKYKVALPEGVDNVDLGIPLGPPDFTSAMDLPKEVAIRLHNQMFQRKLFSLDDLSRRPKEVQAALQSALRLDAATILSVYRNAEKENLPFD